MLSLPSLNSLGCDITNGDEEISTITPGMNSTLVSEVLHQLSNETGREVDYILLYKMAMLGNRHLKESL